MKDRIITWFRLYGDRCLVFLGIVLVGGLCFEAGYLQGKIGREVPVQLSVLPIPANESQPAESVALGVAGASVVLRESSEFISQSLIQSPQQYCPFVGSKNSTKYHLFSCAVARRIKPENRICFASQEEAQKRGYVPSCLK